jgi:hypothetical protein
MRALAPCAYLPAGTTGSVAAEEVAPDRFELVAEFDAVRAPRHWFTCTEFGEYLTEA